jgi:hypothetical protein
MKHFSSQDLKYKKFTSWRVGEGMAEINDTIKVSARFGKLSVKDQIVNILALLGHTIYVIAIQLCHCIVKAPISRI